MAAAGALLWAVVRLIGFDGGPLVQLLAFTPYVAAGSLLPLLARPRAAALGRRAAWRWLASLLLVAVVAPRALPAAQPAADGPTLTVLTANLLAGAADPQALVDAGPRHTTWTCWRCRSSPPTAQAGLDRAGLTALLPHRHHDPRGRHHRLGALLPLPARPAPACGATPGASGFAQAYAHGDVPGGPPVRVESVHPAAPYALSAERRLARRPRRPAAGHPGRAAARARRRLQRHPRPRPAARLLATGYADAADATGSGLAGTWGPYDGDPIPPVTIDHVLADRRIAVALGSAVYGLPGSDHRAVLAVLRLPAAG